MRSLGFETSTENDYSLQDQGFKPLLKSNKFNRANCPLLFPDYKFLLWGDQHLPINYFFPIGITDYNKINACCFSS